MERDRTNREVTPERQPSDLPPTEIVENNDERLAKNENDQQTHGGVNKDGVTSDEVTDGEDG